MKLKFTTKLNNPGTPKRVSKKAVEASGGDEDNGLSNPTPAMLALMEKKAADSAKKKPGVKRQAR